MSGGVRGPMAARGVPRRTPTPRSEEKRMFENQTVELLPARTVMSRWGGGGGGGRSGGGGGGGGGGDALAVSAATIIVEGNVTNSTLTATSDVATATGGAGGTGGNGSFTGGA